MLEGRRWCMGIGLLDLTTAAVGCALYNLSGK